ncbi:hypothetical protein NDU88_000535 [Pleurodeles waltl]|uniref:Uncharacterized protein n=1 Tax=Pleurodeles waltl TaxID=8319 RepID=A0AAV7S9W6_PLEWA|nr:hypothetical protein NDU88_000535 [Pleurodeles waltl]
MGEPLTPLGPTIQISLSWGLWPSRRTWRTRANRDLRRTRHICCHLGDRGAELARGPSDWGPCSLGLVRAGGRPSAAARGGAEAQLRGSGLLVWAEEKRGRTEWHGARGGGLIPGTGRLCGEVFL